MNIHKIIERYEKVINNFNSIKIYKCIRCNIYFKTPKEYGHHHNSRLHHQNKYKQYLF
jgi:uncharacterized C2H2 Zn-finger protein